MADNETFRQEIDSEAPKEAVAHLRALIKHMGFEGELGGEGDDPSEAGDAKDPAETQEKRRSMSTMSLVDES